MQIVKLDPAAYAGKKFTVRYQTGGSYDIQASASGFQIRYQPFESPVQKSFIGLDLYAYSNSDPERHEVRIEMGKKLPLSDKE